MDQEIAGYLITYGPLGVWSVVAALVIRHQNGRIEILTAQLLEDRDKRIEDALKVIPIAEKANDNTDKLADAMLERGRSEAANTAVLGTVVQKLRDLENMIKRRPR